MDLLHADDVAPQQFAGLMRYTPTRDALCILAMGRNSRYSTY